jgi:hypothetical protein
LPADSSLFKDHELRFFHLAIRPDAFSLAHESWYAAFSSLQSTHIAYTLSVDLKSLLQLNQAAGQVAISGLSFSELSLSRISSKTQDFFSVPVCSEHALRLTPSK